MNHVIEHLTVTEHELELGAMKLHPIGKLVPGSLIMIPAVRFSPDGDTCDTACWLIIAVKSRPECTVHDLLVLKCWDDRGDFWVDR